MEKILFIDRDGTLVKEPFDYQVDSLHKIRLVEQVISALSSLRDAGYRLIMVTNQDGLGTDQFPQEDFDICHTFIIELFQSQGIVFDDILICPHNEEDNCDCRKPKLGLVSDYIKTRRFDLNHSYVIGDRQSDLKLADNMGIKGILIDDNMTWSNIAKNILTKPRVANIDRKTAETHIKLSLNLDDDFCEIDTPCQFLNHMLEQVSKHAGIQLIINARGDIDVDDHHLVEDIAICLGRGINEALYDRRGIGRYGFTLPMDDSLATAVIDLSGRATCVFQGAFERERVSDLSTEMVPHFFKTLSDNMAATIHLSIIGDNTHHMIEACFKAFGRALKQAIAIEGNSIASTKGCL